jgi:voltage-gated potassium channel
LSRTPHLVIGIFLFILMLLAGTAGYMFIEGWPFIDALYMTVITLATVGFREVHELSLPGRVFTMVLIIAGVGFVFYLAGGIIQFMVEGRIRDILGRRKLEKELRKQKDHYIICGFGRVGSSICDLLASKPLGMVVSGTLRELPGQAIATSSMFLVRRLRKKISSWRGSKRLGDYWPF